MKRFKRTLSLFLFLTLAIALFVGLNYFSTQTTLRWDVTEEKLYTLPDKAKESLKAIEKPVSLYLFYQPLHPYYKKLRDFLKEIDLLGKSNIKIYLIDPERDHAQAELFSKKNKVAAYNTLIIQSEDRLRQLSDSDFVEEKEKSTFFKAGSAIVNAIYSVTQKEKREIYFISGHGEKDLDDLEERGVAGLKILYKKNNAVSTKWILPIRKKIPEKGSLAVIVGPTKSFEKEEIDALEKYVNEGGKLLVFLDPLVQTGLEELLSQWGIETKNQVVVDPSTGSPQVSAANLFVANYPKHPAVAQMTGLITLFVVTRPILPNSTVEDWAVSPLATTTPNGWGESQITTQVYQFDPAVDLKGPIAVAVAAESKGSSKGRVVVVGDSEFVTNSQIGNLGNQEFLAGISKWLLAQESWITLPSKKVKEVQLHLNQTQMRQIFWSSLVGLPLMSLGFGVIVWSRRRF